MLWIENCIIIYRYIQYVFWPIWSSQCVGSKAPVIAACKQTKPNLSVSNWRCKIKRFGRLAKLVPQRWRPLKQCVYNPLDDTHHRSLICHFKCIWVICISKWFINRSQINMKHVDSSWLLDATDAVFTVELSPTIVYNRGLTKISGLITQVFLLSYPSLDLPKTPGTNYLRSLYFKWQAKLAKHSQAKLKIIQPYVQMLVIFKFELLVISGNSFFSNDTM